MLTAARQFAAFRSFLLLAIFVSRELLKSPRGRSEALNFRYWLSIITVRRCIAYCLLRVLQRKKNSVGQGQGQTRKKIRHLHVRLTCVASASHACGTPWGTFSPTRPCRLDSKGKFDDHGGMYSNNACASCDDGCCNYVSCIYTMDDGCKKYDCLSPENCASLGGENHGNWQD